MCVTLKEDALMTTQGEKHTHTHTHTHRKQLGSVLLQSVMCTATTVPYDIHSRENSAIKRNNPNAWGAA